jgi:hypothetical protein
MFLAEELLRGGSSLFRSEKGDETEIGAWRLICGQIV